MEVDFINTNWKYAEKVIKKYNDKNDIIYVAREGLGNINRNVICFVLETEAYVGRIYEMRHLFDASIELTRYLSDTISNEKKAENLNYDRITNMQKMKAGYIEKSCEAKLDGLDAVVLKGFEIQKEEGLYLWGAGKCGMQLAKYLSERNVTILGIIDNSYTVEAKKDGMTICGFDNRKDYKRIFIAIDSEKTSDEIVEQINSSLCKGIKVYWRWKSALLHMQR